MKLRKLKLQFPGTTRTLVRMPGALPPLHMLTDGRQSPTGHTADTSKLMSCVLMLQRLLGVALSSIAVSVQVGNILVCIALLLLGPTLLLDLVPEVKLG